MKNPKSNEQQEINANWSRGHLGAVGLCWDKDRKTCESCNIILQTGMCVVQVLSTAHDDAKSSPDHRLYIIRHVECRKGNPKAF